MEPDTMFRKPPPAIERRGPLRVLFVITSMPVGGAETLLVELIRRMDRRRFRPELACLKELGPLGEVLADEVPTHTGLISKKCKLDVRVFFKLASLIRRRNIDAVVTVGTGGDKMFWGRLAAWFSGVPVICSALHSTGLPDRVEFSNRLLAPLTDAFIGVAEPHGEYLAEKEGCPAERVRVIPNGVDTDRFRSMPHDAQLAESLDVRPETPIISLVAALRPEKNHELFIDVAARVGEKYPDSRFWIIGDGPRRDEVAQMIEAKGLGRRVRMLGNRSNIPELLSLSNLFLLTSHMEANPVSIMEAMACELPVIAPRIGSVPETVRHDETGLLVEPSEAQATMAEVMAGHVDLLLSDPEKAASQGRAGRALITKSWSIDGMVRGYEDLIEAIYQEKAANRRSGLSLAFRRAARQLARRPS